MYVTCPVVELVWDKQSLVLQPRQPGCKRVRFATAPREFLEKSFGAQPAPRALRGVPAASSHGVVTNHRETDGTIFTKERPEAQGGAAR